MQESSSNNNGQGRLIRRLPLYEDDCRRLLVQAYQCVRDEEADQQKVQEEQFGNNRVPVLPSSTSRTDGNKNSSSSAYFSADSSDDDVDHQGKGNGDGNDKNNDDSSDDASLSESSADEGDDGQMKTVPEEATEEDDEDETSLAAATPNDGPVDSATNPIAAPVLTRKPSKKKNQPSSKQQKRQSQAVHQHSLNLMRFGLPLLSSGRLSQDERLQLFSPTALLSKANLQDSRTAQALAMKTLSEQLQGQNNSNSSNEQRRPYIVVLLLQSGRFAAGVFRGSKCVVHRTSTHYTVRKGQGKAQSSQDGNRRPKSMGSQLRRAGEQSTKEDVQDTLKEWKRQQPYLDEASLIFVACPKTMRSTLFFNDADHNGGGASSTTKATTDIMLGGSGGTTILSKDDPRIRRIPFDVGRPSYENVQIVHEVMMGVDVRAVLSSSSDPSTGFVDGAKEDDREDGMYLAKMNDQKRRKDEEEAALAAERLEQLAIDLPLNPLHLVARDGNLEALLDLLSKMDQNEKEKGDDNVDENGERDNNITKKVDPINQAAGYDCMTPLHFAAASTSAVDPITAAACVSALLIQGQSADPTIQDARGRVPYFLATEDKVRDAFRKARAMLGEDYCDWDAGAKVGPPLTEDDINARKEKEAEKKRRKKARQREKRAKEQALAQEMEERRKAEEEQQRQAEEGKRVRDGLSANKPKGSNVCDYCRKDCKGKRRNQMFERLDYKYCSTDCVNEHKRELMAKAAMARFGGS